MILEPKKYDVYTFWPRILSRSYTWWGTIAGKEHAQGFKDMILANLPTEKHGFGVSIIETGGEPWDGEHFTNGDTV